MDINRPKEIITTLGESIDPTTGEILPDHSVSNEGENHLGVVYSFEFAALDFQAIGWHV